MQSELKPCPFCGGEARLWPVTMPFDADCDSITVQCTECNAIGADVLVDQDVHSQSDLADLEAETIAAWNTRASDAEIARLNSAIKLQAAAVRTLQANEQTEINMLRAKAREAHIAIATLDSEREANAILTEALRAAEERNAVLLDLTVRGYVLCDGDDEDVVAFRNEARAALKEQPHD